MQITPLKSLNKAYRRQKVSRPVINQFKDQLNWLLKELDEQESEEHVKNNLIAFFNEVWYKDQHHINTKDRTDLVIHQDKSGKSNPAVLIEVKKPTNTSEMISSDQLNAKALQELVLYYLRERVDNENTEIKYLIVTNIYEWFVFDATEFYEHFYQNKQLLKAYKEWSTGQLDSKKTDAFYKDIASKYLELVKDQLDYTWFDLKAYQKHLDKVEGATPLITLYKLLSPEHLLKKPFANDSNSLNKQFYHELLHIIGLEEVKEKGKKIIQRKEKGKRQEGTLLENAIDTMDEKDRLRILDKPSHFGATAGEQYYTVGLELCITWINRILFLKLLESQLVGYHRGDQSYRFLNSKTIPNYDALDSLFFGVLAKKLADRKERDQDKFSQVPYLNSSLFEPTGLEEVLTVTMLNNNLEMELYAQSVLKDAKGNRLKGKMDTLSYLFAFLEAYDFSSEGTEEIQEENKSLINASVLGLIFEKINGYKDGSFYTPGFITMYMCRETLRRAVVQKFNEVKGWSLETFDQLYDRIEDKKEANEIINSLRICDPAVGSGHFLVSALNELISIKSDLKILLDRDGRTLRDYGISIENDELIIEDDNQELFQYVVGSKEKQRIQETLFQEKQTLIENCLFGVDINPNSVKICRLRLWIELLKNAYYKSENELETLPNIDINIKTGNSLISRFDLDTDISEALKKSKWDIHTYQNAVENYKNAASKEDKREFERLIESIKGDFETEIGKKDKRLIRVQKLRGELFNLTQQQSMFEMGAKEKTKWEKAVGDKTKALDKLETELDEIKNNKMYEDAFEWRFEFPEVLDDQGNFQGFDVVIGNPPYVNIVRIEQEKEREYLMKSYKVAKNKSDLYSFFIEIGKTLLKARGNLNYIVSNSWYSISSFELLREFMINQTQITCIVDLYNGVFDEATVTPSIIFFSNDMKDNYPIVLARGNGSEIVPLDFNIFKKDIQANPSYNITFNRSLPIRIDTVPLQSICSFSLGIKTGNDRKFISSQKNGDQYFPLLRGKDIKKYGYNFNDNWIWYAPDEMKENIGARPRVYENFQKEKIILKEIGSKIIGTIENEGYLVNDTVNSIFDVAAEYSLKFLVAVLNSSFINYWYKINFDSGLHIKLNELAKVPFPSILKTEDKQRIENIVDQIYFFLDQDKEEKISVLEKQIDQLVYELYGLTEEEIKIIEESK